MAIWDGTWDASFGFSPRRDSGGDDVPLEGQDAVRAKWASTFSGIGLAVENIRQKQRIQRREHFATVGELAAGLAHEVRTPAGVIKGAAQFLTREALLKDREFLDIIVEEADRLNSVVTEFLEYARPADRTPSRISLQEPVERAMARLRRERSRAMERIRSRLHFADSFPA